MPINAYDPRMAFNGLRNIPKKRFRNQVRFVDRKIACGKTRLIPLFNAKLLALSDVLAGLIRTINQEPHPPYRFAQVKPYDLNRADKAGKS